MIEETPDATNSEAGIVSFDLYEQLHYGQNHIQINHRGPLRYVHSSCPFPRIKYTKSEEKETTVPQSHQQEVSRQLPPPTYRSFLEAPETNLEEQLEKRIAHQAIIANQYKLTDKASNKLQDLGMRVGSYFTWFVQSPDRMKRQGNSSC